MNPLFPRFLSDENEYAKATAYWLELWNRIPSFDRVPHEWQPNWFLPQRDGNPIFSAVSRIEHKGIRVIQYEPTVDAIEIDFWLDTFGGSITDPRTIRELVVACALSEESSQFALNLMSAWCAGDIQITNIAERGTSPVETVTSIRESRHPIHERISQPIRVYDEVV